VPCWRRNGCSPFSCGGQTPCLHRIFCVRDFVVFPVVVLSARLSARSALRTGSWRSRNSSSTSLRVSASLMSCFFQLTITVRAFFRSSSTSAGTLRLSHFSDLRSLKRARIAHRTRTRRHAVVEKKKRAAVSRRGAWLDENRVNLIYGYFCNPSARSPDSTGAGCFHQISPMSGRRRDLSKGVGTS
jgi:hypothetical protein